MPETSNGHIVGGRNAPRSKNGCTSCLIRKVKCDEHRPECQRCKSGKVKCSWDPSIRKQQQARRRHQGSVARHKEAVSKQLVHSRGHHTKPVLLSRPNPYASQSPASPSRDSSGSSSVLESRGDQEENIYSCSFLSNSDELLFFGPEMFDDTFDSPVPWSDPSSSIPWTLSTTHIPCTNSVLLSTQDRSYLEYFPSSTTVYTMGKSYEWSNFRHLCQKTGASDSMVMRSILALSASELHRLGKDNHELALTKNRDPGLSHYGLALQELLVVLSDLKNPKYSLESVLGALYLLICYEAKFGVSVFNLKLHIEGVRSYIESQLATIIKQGTSSDRIGKSPLTPYCAQLLLWMACIDASCVRGLMSFRLYDFFHSSPVPYLRPDRLFIAARSSCRKLYGEDYPMKEVQDDFENYRALELVNQDYSFRYRICRLAEAIEDGKPIDDSAEAIWDDIETTGEKYNDLMTGRVAESLPGRRVLRTLRDGMAGYCADIVLHRCLLWPSKPQTQTHRDALSKILEIAHQSYSENGPWNLIMLLWPLLLAGIETDDPIHGSWIRERLGETRIAGNSSEWACKTLDKAKALKSDGIEGPRNLLRLLKTAPDAT